MSDEEDFEPESLVFLECPSDQGYGHPRVIFVPDKNNCVEREITGPDLNNTSMESRLIKIKNMMELRNSKSAKPMEESQIEEFKKDGAPSKRVLDMMKKIQENDFKGKSKRSITIRDEKSDLQDMYDIGEKSDGSEKETSVEKDVYLEKKEENITEQYILQRDDRLDKERDDRMDKKRDGRLDKKRDNRMDKKRDGRLDKKRSKHLEGHQRDQVSGQCWRSCSPVQDNRFASMICNHSDLMEEEETPVKELMVVAMENEYTFDSMESDTSFLSMDFGNKKLDLDPDKDDDETEKMDEVKPDTLSMEELEYLMSTELDSLEKKGLPLDNFQKSYEILAPGISEDKSCTMENLHSTDGWESVDKNTTCQSYFNMDVDYKTYWDSSDLSTEILEKDIAEEGHDKGKTSMLAEEFDTLSEGLDVDKEKDELAKAKMGLQTEEEIIEEDVDSDNSCAELIVYLELFSVESSTLKSVCRRELKDITNLLLMSKGSIQGYTKESQRPEEVTSMKGDNHVDDVDRLVLEDKEPAHLSFLTSTLTDLRMEKTSLDKSLRDLTALRSKIVQGFTIQIRESKKLKKKVKQLEDLYLEMYIEADQHCAVRKLSSENFIPLIITSNVNLQPRFKNLLYKRTGRISNLSVKRLFSEKDWTGFFSRGVWTSAQDFKCKGDNLQRQPSDSDNGCHGNGYGGGFGGQKSSGERNDSKEEENKESRRNLDDEKDIDEKEHQAVFNNDLSETPTASTAPSSNYKYRKKMSEEEKKMETYEKLAELKEDIPPDIMKDIGECLVACLNSRKIGGSDVVSDCCICAFLFSLISHFGNCPSEYNSCDMCQRAFCLVSKHLQLCLECGISETGRECPLTICKKIQSKFRQHPEKISQRGRELWPKLKKYLARFSQRQEDVGQDIPLDEGEDYFSLTSIQLGSLSSIGSIGSLGVPSSRQSRPSRPSTVFQPNLQSISETATAIQFSGSHSEPLARKTESGEVIYRRPSQPSRPGRLHVADDSRLPYPRVSIQSIAETQVESQFTGFQSEQFARKTESGEVIYRRPSQPSRPGRQLVSDDSRLPYPRDVTPNLETAAAIRSLPSPEETPQSNDEDDQYTSLNREKVYGGRTSSLPMNFYPPDMAGEQLISVQMGAVGYPGIGEVVYANKEYLRYVARHWKKIQADYSKDKTYEKKHLREEGVILTENKENFSIFRTRYQKNFQWIRLTHLGTGMSGKCHLAQDYNTDFKFCIKKVNILKFDERELDIWSDLSHPNIVQLFGAIRHGHNIYILEEFIDGGCLTETINLQKETGHRLSHWTALNYLQQILQVLVYLEKRSVIHEDIKADNILLRKGTTKVVVSDFGVARRMEHVIREASPVGTPTSYSPEKAKGQGHGARSDVWAAICVLIHMLSGWPPWIRRYGSVGTLNFIIAEREPPLQDLPSNVSQDVYNLVEFVLKKDPTTRPSASKALQHEAFRLLRGERTPETFVSVLESPLNTDIKISDDIDKAVIDEVKEQYLQPPQCTLPLSQNGGSTVSQSLPTQSSVVVQSLSTQSSAVVQSLSTQSSAVVQSPSTQSSAVVQSLSTECLSVTYHTDLTQGGNDRTIQTSRLEARRLGPDEIGDGILTSIGMVTPRHPPNIGPNLNSQQSYEGQTNIQDLGVMPPPSPAKYVPIDPKEFFLRYVNDSDVNLENFERKYKNFLQPFHPDPDTESNSSEEDIETTLNDLDKSFANIPDLHALFGNIDLDDERQGPASIPDVVHEMIDKALQQNMRDWPGEGRQAIDDTTPTTSGSVTEEPTQGDPHVLGGTSAAEVIPNLEFLLDDQSSQNSNSNNANLPTVLDSLEDTVTLTGQKSSSSDISLHESSASSEEQRMGDFSPKSSSEDEPPYRTVLVPTSQKATPGKVPDNAVLPDWEILMAFNDDENSNISMDDLFGSGDEDESQGQTWNDVTRAAEFPVKGQGQTRNDVSRATEFPVKGQGQTWNDLTMTSKQVSAHFNNLPAPVQMQPFFPNIITDKNTGAISKVTKSKPQPVNIGAPRVATETDDRSLSPIKSQSLSPHSPKTSTPLMISNKHNKKNLHLNLTTNKRKPDRQTSQPQPCSTHEMSPNLREVKPYFTPQQMTSPPQWRTGSTPPKSSGTSSVKSDSRMEQQQKENEIKIAEFLEEMSRHSGNSRSQIDELDYMSDPEDVSIANDDEEEFQASLMRIQQDYTMSDVTKSDSYGALVRVVTLDKELFNIRLEGEHIRKTWEEVIDAELSEKLAEENISNFILVDTDEDPLDLAKSPIIGEQTIYVREPREDSPWNCSNTLINKVSFY